VRCALSWLTPADFGMCIVPYEKVHDHKDSKGRDSHVAVFESD
jgi:hypothetical protein